MEQFKIGVDMNLIIYFSSYVILNVIITLIDHSPNTAYQDQYKQIANKHRVFKNSNWPEADQLVIQLFSEKL